MASQANPIPDEAKQLSAANGLALVRVTIGAMLVLVCFENLGKRLYHPASYSSLINYYIAKGHSPALWKAVESVVANHASIAAPMQALTEISLGVLLVIVVAAAVFFGTAFLFRVDEVRDVVDLVWRKFGRGNQPSA